MSQGFYIQPSCPSNINAVRNLLERVRTQKIFTSLAEEALLDNSFTQPCADGGNLSKPSVGEY